MATNWQENDKQIGRAITFGDDKSRLTVALFSYKGGPRKIQITREYTTGGGWNWAKLGRLSLSELKAINEVTELLIKEADQASDEVV
jgi:hypothetical protein